MTVRIPGVLLVKRINGRNGPFNVGELVTDIGDFKVIDMLIDQFREGKYQGTFVISQIYPTSYVAHGRIVVEIRAKLADVQINNQGKLQARTPVVQEIDPADEEVPVRSARLIPAAPVIAARPKAVPKKPEPVVTAKANAGPKKVKSCSNNSVPDLSTDDLALFGEEISALIRQRQPLKLESTVDRLQLRAQIKRLNELGYGFNALIQTWSANAPRAASTP